MSAAFTIAPKSERTLDLGAYLLGIAELALIVGAVGFAAWRLRATLVPAWSGAPARLIESVLGIAVLIWLAEALGTFGAYGEASMLIVSVLTAIAALLVCRRLERRSFSLPAPAPPAPPASTLAVWFAAVACAAVAAAWMVPTLASLAGGMDRADTLWYHMPLSARFADTGDFASIDYFDPIFFASFYPANSEVLHSVPILTLDRDFISPLLNLGFLLLGMLAAYCIGRPWGLGPLSLIGGGIALGAQMLIEFQAGEALNDIVGVALFLAAVAVLVNANRAGDGWAGAPEATGNLRRLPLALSGVAAGLAAGTKFSFLAPSFALLVGLVAIASPRMRLRAGLWFALPAFAAGGYWYLRNLFAIGNPIPFSSFGPLNLPIPEQTFELREGFSIAHYWDDPEVWIDWFVPGLSESFGVLWPLTIVAVIATGVYAVWRGGEPLLQMLGGVILFSSLAYVFTPLTAAGEEGFPIAFEWNARYFAPAVVVALSILPCLPIARASERSRQFILVGISILFIVTVASLVQWRQGHVKGAVAAGIGVFAVFAAIRWARGRELVGPRAPRHAVAGLAASVLIAGLLAGWWVQGHYLERRYHQLSPIGRLDGAARWARDLRGARIAVSGVRGVFNQYPFYGTALANEVQWLGEKGPHGAFLRIPDCASWRRALAEGGYTHVVTTYDPFRPGTLTDTKEAVWTREDPAAEEIRRDGPVSVFELRGKPNPSGCDTLPQLTAAELNGDSANIEPTANQPG